MQLAQQPCEPHIVICSFDDSAADVTGRERLESQYGTCSDDSFVCVGDIIPTDMQDGFLRCAPSLLHCKRCC